MTDPLNRLSNAGVSIWLDDLSRVRLIDGSLGRLVHDRHVLGVTTNPTIGRAVQLDGDVLVRSTCRRRSPPPPAPAAARISRGHDDVPRRRGLAPRGRETDIRV
jgi:hypothetical protein